jgi:hypothetical protein
MEARTYKTSVYLYKISRYHIEERYEFYAQSMFFTYGEGSISQAYKLDVV